MGATDGPQVICDTRQQAGHHGHVDGWLEAHGVSYEYRKVDFGDYVRGDEAGNVSVDTKKDVQELAANCGRDHARFVRELVRARDAGWRLYVLVEQHPEYEDRAKLEGWVSGVCRRCHFRARGMCRPSETRGARCLRGARPMQGDALAKILDTMERRYGVRFMFCAKRDTARVICGLLGVEVKDG